MTYLEMFCGVCMAQKAPEDLDVLVSNLNRHYDVHAKERETEYVYSRSFPQCSTDSTPRDVAAGSVKSVTTNVTQKTR